jgi:hypothetical protein
LRDVIAAHSRAVVPTKLDRQGAPHGSDLMVLSYLRGLPREREANTEAADATDEAATPPHGTRWDPMRALELMLRRCQGHDRRRGATLPWAELEAEATRQGCSPADIFFGPRRAVDPYAGAAAAEPRHP